MRGTLTSVDVITEIKILRSQGLSISEISKKVNKSKSVISKYVQDVQVLPEFEEDLKIKQGGSKTRARLKWAEKNLELKKLIPSIDSNQKLIILA